MFQSEVKKKTIYPKLQNEFHNRVLKWVANMQVGPSQFRMNEGADSTIFTSCFALFIFDLFGEVRSWTQKEKDIWVDYVNSFQDEDTGYFIPGGFKGDFDTKPVQQLTCFCLSVLDIFDTKPRYKLSFLKQWQAPDDVYDYLNNKRCHEGRPGTGNIAMFLGIFLTYQYEKHRDGLYKDLINSWFYYHERTQNKATGFWGNSTRNKYYWGFQNAFHQFVIFNYWNRAIPYHDKIVDNVLSLQDIDGHFAPIPGGGGCFDYDAADILINCGYRNGYKKNEIEAALCKLHSALLRGQNEDGGFCESQKSPSNLLDIYKCIDFVLYSYDPYLLYYRLKNVIIASLRNRNKTIKTHWTNQGRKCEQSDLWDTWFRCLTLAEIEESIKFNGPLNPSGWNFHKFIGLGSFHNLQMF